MRRQRAIQSIPLDTSSAGHWRIVASPPYAAPVEISRFRGVETKVTGMSYADPFGPQAMNILLPGVTLFDRLGAGDLHWVNRFTNVDAYWEGDLPAGYGASMLTPGMTWQGYIIRRRRSQAGLELQLKGALLQLDNWLAKPEYTARPLPYEWAIARQFLDKPALRLMPLRILWPDWWPTQYVPQTGKPSYMIPAGVTEGDNWTHMLTRSTGTWDPALTSYIASLLAAMYTERGRWTIDLDGERQPVMRFMEFPTGPSTGMVTINPRDPGVLPSLDEDDEETLTTVYAQGSSNSGISYTGMQVSADGTRTSYRPMAALRQVYPPLSTNAWFDDQAMPKEVMLQMQQGLSPDDAAIVARAHLTRFAEPGIVGTITLGSDPYVDGVPIPRHLVRAGMDVHVPYLFGNPDGVVLHVSNSEANLTDGKVTLTVDSKFRDALTVAEVRQRGRDALQVTRMLVAGQYTPPVPDQLYPWSYEEGSGYIPSNSVYSAVPLFDGMPDEVAFPWTEWTTQRPPSDTRWKNCYLRLGPAQDNADANWITQSSSWGSAMGVPIRMAQAGTVRLLQVAAYDANGNVMKVPFHLSFYYVGSVNVASMPLLPVEQVPMFPPYAAGQHYPFVRDGFETYQIDGTRTNPQIPHPTESAGLVRAYGNFYEKAGFWPGSYAEGDAPTGLLVDEDQWSFDISGVGDAVFDPYSLESNLTNPHSGQLYAMLYCDAQLTQEVFFVGRIFRVEPGTGV